MNKYWAKKKTMPKCIKNKLEKLISKAKDKKFVCDIKIPDGNIKLFQVDGKVFKKVFSINRKYLFHGDSTAPANENDFYENENYVTENGLSGFSLTKKGWGCSLFSNQPWNGFAKGVKNIITDKTKKIVCINSENDFSHNLVDMYENLLGFSVCATTIDDEKIMREYYGNKFMNNFVKRQGKKPHHVFMIRSKTKPKEIKTFEDYFEAYEYVDKLEIK